MRGYLINSERKTIDEISGAFDDCDEIYRVIGCESFTTGSRPLRGDLMQGFDAVYVSDDELEDGDTRVFGFRLTRIGIRRRLSRLPETDWCLAQTRKARGAT